MSPPRPQLTRTAPGLDVTQQLRPDQVVGGLEQREVQGDHVAAADQVEQVRAADVRRGFADRVVGEDRHAQRGAEDRGPLADAAVADDTEHRPGEVTDRNGAAGRPLSGPDQGGERAETLDQMHRHGDGALGDRGGSGARRDHHGDPPGGGGVEVDPLDAHSGPRHHPQARRAGQELLVDLGIGPGNGALRDRQIRLGRIRDEPALPTEDGTDQGGVDVTQADHHRQLCELRHR